MILRSWRNYDAKAVSRSCALDTGTSTKVIQSARDDADINVIVKRFNVTGQLPQLNREALNVDLDEVVDYRTAMQFVRQAAEQFMSLPSTLRERFQNDPQEFMAFMDDPENAAEAEKLGLLKIRQNDTKRPSNSPSTQTNEDANERQAKADAGNPPQAAARSADANRSRAAGAGTASQSAAAEV